MKTNAYNIFDSYDLCELNVPTHKALKSIEDIVNIYMSYLLVSCDYSDHVIAFI